MNRYVQVLVALASITIICFGAWFAIAALARRQNAAIQEAENLAISLAAMDQMNKDAELRKATDAANAAQTAKDKAIRECRQSLRDWYISGKDVVVGAPGEPRHLDETECQKLIDDQYAGTKFEQRECDEFLKSWSAGVYRGHATTRVEYCQRLPRLD